LNPPFKIISVSRFITGFLVARSWRDLKFRFPPSSVIALTTGVAPVLVLALSFLDTGAPGDPDSSALSVRMLSFVSGWIAIALWTLGRCFISGLVFPAAFLIFMVSPRTAGGVVCESHPKKCCFFQ
jgi:hypothetical protein